MKSLAYEIEHFLKSHKQSVPRTLCNQSGNHADDALRIPVYDAVWKNVGMKVYEDFFRKDEK